MYESEEATIDPKEMAAEAPAAPLEPLEGEGNEALGGELEAQTEALPAPADAAGAAAAVDPAVAAARADLAILREEMMLLREELGQAREKSARQAAEQAEFCELYPEADPQALPDEVWAQVRSGIPLAAAFALFERRKLRLQQKATAQDAENRARSCGRIEKEKDGYYSPDEVRAMKPNEVRAHYQAILASMKKWQ